MLRVSCSSRWKFGGQAERPPYDGCSIEGKIGDGTALMEVRFVRHANAISFP